MKNNIYDRLGEIQNKIPENSALLIEDQLNLFYFTGIQLSAGSLLITPQEAQLFVDGRYLEICQKESCINSAALETDNIILFFVFHKIDLLFFDSGKTSYRRYTELSQDLEIKLRPFNEGLCQFRKIKDHNEIKLLQQAAELGTQGYNFIKRQLKEGVSEKELAQQLKLFWIGEGAEDLAFESCIAFGDNSAFPHHHPSDHMLKNNNIILADIGVKKNGYCSDMTRMLSFGNVCPEILKIYDIVLEAQMAALKYCRAGITAGDLDKAAREVILKHGYGEYFTHGLGHGIGLEVHEFPYISHREKVKDTILEENMIITIEPGIYLPGIGGVRLEDSVVVQKNGIINLSKAPKSLI